MTKKEQLIQKYVDRFDEPLPDTIFDFFWAEIEKRDAKTYDDGYEAGYRSSLERIKELDEQLNQRQ
jgi:hypothetical protein